MARVYDKLRHTVTNTDTETGATATVYYGRVPVPGGPKHSPAFYEDMRARVGMGACSTCQLPFAEHSDAEIDVCLDKFMAAQKGS